MSNRWMITRLISSLVVIFPLSIIPGNARSSPETPYADESTKSPDAPAVNKPSAIELELEELRSELATQRQALEKEERRVALLEARLSKMRVVTSAEGNPPDTAIQPLAAEAAPPMSRAENRAAQINITQPEHPISFKIGAADFTPGGFADIAAIYRSKDFGSGLGTNFEAIPYSNSLPQGQLSEFRFTAQSSRLSLKVDANVSESTSVTGYAETDFNGYQPPNAQVNKNSNTLRLRLYWVNITHGRWEFLGGQSWSLLTPNRVGLSPLPGDIFSTLLLDTNYVAGLVYARQAGFRVVYHPASSWSIGASRIAWDSHRWAARRA